jgi:hypothetical protein
MYRLCEPLTRNRAVAGVHIHLDVFPAPSYCHEQARPEPAKGVSSTPPGWENGCSVGTRGWEMANKGRAASPNFNFVGNVMSAFDRLPLPVRLALHAGVLDWDPPV